MTKLARIALIGLLTLLSSIVASETPDECAARLDQSIAVSTYDEAVSKWTQIQSVCAPVPEEISLTPGIKQVLPNSKCNTLLHGISGDELSLSIRLPLELIVKSPNIPRIFEIYPNLPPGFTSFYHPTVIDDYILLWDKPTISIPQHFEIETWHGKDRIGFYESIPANYILYIVCDP